jgi:hypothetical protein
MASDVSASINVLQLAIEVGAIALSVGGLVFMVKSHQRKIESLEKKMDEVRENWVDRRYLEQQLQLHEDRMVGKILLALGSTHNKGNIP